MICGIFLVRYMCVFYNAHPSSKPAKTRVIVFMETMTWLVSKSEATVLMSSLGFPDSSVGKESACNAGDSGSVPGTGRFSGEGIGYLFQYSWTSLVAELVKNPPAVRETWVRTLGWEDPLEKGKATHSSIPA